MLNMCYNLDVHISSPESGICKYMCVNLTGFLVKYSNNNNSKICHDFWIPGDIMLMEIVS